MLFTKEYDIKYYEKNVNGELKESALLNFLQDVATLSAESLGFGPTFVFSNNYAWVVLKYHIELYKELRNLSSVIIKTEPRGTSRLYAFRDFEICSFSGECIGKAISTWTLIDIESRKILPASKLLPMMPAYVKKSNDLDYKKIDCINEPLYEKVFDVRFDDIDINRHANNSNYIVWALETLPEEFRLSHCISSIDIKFKKETTLGCQVYSCASVMKSENAIVTTHSLKDICSGEELSVIRIEWHKTASIA